MMMEEFSNKIAFKMQHENVCIDLTSCVKTLVSLYNVDLWGADLSG